MLRLLDHPLTLSSKELKLMRHVYLCHILASWKYLVGIIIILTSHMGNRYKEVKKLAQRLQQVSIRTGARISHFKVTL